MSQKRNRLDSFFEVVPKFNKYQYQTPHRPSNAIPTQSKIKSPPESTPYKTPSYTPTTHHPTLGTRKTNRCAASFSKPSPQASPKAGRRHAKLCVTKSWIAVRKTSKTRIAANGWGTKSGEVVNPPCHLGSGTKGEMPAAGRFTAPPLNAEPRLPPRPPPLRSLHRRLIHSEKMTHLMPYCIFHQFPQLASRPRHPFMRPLENCYAVR